MITIPFLIYSIQEKMWNKSDWLMTYIFFLIAVMADTLLLVMVGIVK